MRIIGKKKLLKFTQNHADCKSWINSWVAETDGTVWKTPQDVKDRYSSASFLENRIIIFNVKGNAYRMEVQVSYNTGVVAIKWIGTHAEYTKRFS